MNYDGTRSHQSELSDFVSPVTMEKNQSRVEVFSTAVLGTLTQISKQML